MEDKLTGIVTKQNHKIELLEKKCEIYEENMDALRAIVSKQQRTISSIDQENRDKNIIMSGLSEDVIEMDDTKYENDEGKINQLFEILGVHTPEGYEAMRIGKGKGNPNYH